MKLLNSILLLLLLFIFNGCASKIDFKEYRSIEKAQTVSYDRQIPILNIDNIQTFSNSVKIDTYQLKQLVSMNNKYYQFFDTKNISDIKLELYLTDLYYTKTYHPKKHKKHTKKKKHKKHKIKNKNQHKQVINIYNNYNYGSPHYTQPQNIDFGLYTVNFNSRIKVKLITPYDVMVYDSDFTISINDEYGYRDKTYSNMGYFTKSISNNLNNIFYKVRDYLNPPFDVIEIYKHKEENNNYVLKLNGGTCDNISSGFSARITNENGRYMGSGEIARNSSCNVGWIITDSFRRKPTLDMKVFTRFYEY